QGSCCTPTSGLEISALVLRLAVSVAMGRSRARWRFFALIMRYFDGGRCLRDVSPNICGLDRDSVNAAGPVNRTVGAESDSVIPRKRPIGRGMAAALSLLSFITAHADDFPGHRPAFVGDHSAYDH